MPVYEYECNSCGEKYELLHNVKENQQDVICPSCNSTNSKKMFSPFSASIKSSSSNSPLPPGCSSCCAGPNCGLN